MQHSRFEVMAGHKPAEFSASFWGTGNQAIGNGQAATTGRLSFLRHDIFFTAGGFHDPLMIDGLFSSGQYRRSIN